MNAYDRILPIAQPEPQRMPCSVLVVKSDGAAEALAARIAARPAPPASPGGDAPWTRAA